MEGPQNARHPDTVEICVVLEGQIHVILDGVERIQSLGEVAIIPPGVVHSSWTQRTAIEEVVAHLQADGLPGRDQLQAGIWPSEALGGLDALRSARTLDAREAAVLALVAASVENPDRARLTDPRMTRLLSAVRARLDRAWPVSEMARTAGMSPRSLRRAFQASLGKSPRAWLIALRVQRAAQLLDTTDRSVSDIALAVGFNSTSRLSEAFTRSRGMPPSTWRVR